MMQLESLSLGYCIFCGRWNDWLAAHPQPCTDDHGHDFTSDPDAILRRLRDLAWNAYKEAYQ